MSLSSLNNHKNFNSLGYSYQGFPVCSKPCQIKSIFVNLQVVNMHLNHFTKTYFINQNLTQMFLRYSAITRRQFAFIFLKKHIHRSVGNRCAWFWFSNSETVACIERQSNAHKVRKQPNTHTHTHNFMKPNTQQNLMIG